MKKTLIIAGMATLTLFACKKDDSTETINEDLKTTEQRALNDFVDIVAVPQYNDLALKADALNSAVVALNASPTEANLSTAKKAWIDMRAIWEQCEGFLFGPVDEDEYDPSMDTWPTDYVAMDSLLASSFAFNQTNIQNVTLSLRGFHPVEYILFGDEDAPRAASSLTARQKEYMVSLSADLQANCHALSNSWAVTGGNYAGLVKTAGYGSAKYASRREVFTTIADGLVAICEEVGTGKMQDPLGVTVAEADPKLVESPYSGNSVKDFKNNIIGLENVYLSRYNIKTGRSLSDVVKANNQALDNKIRSQITTAINSFDNITMSFGKAIVGQRQQIQQTQAALATLSATLDGELRAYILQYVKD